jgi:hypothetical protein
MPVTTAPEASDRFQVLRVTTPSSTAECRAVLVEAIAAPAFLEHRALLVDRRAAEPATIEFVDEMVGFVAICRAALAGGRAAIVTASDVAYGMSRMMELKAEAHNPEMVIRTFRSYDEAVSWLTEAEPSR